MEHSGIVEYYKGRSVFITGATGFMGKVLVEKLLRSCPGIEHLYLLMRPFKDQNVLNRLEELISNQIFDNVRRQQPEVLMTKITAVTGDVTSPGFGLSPSDLQLLTENVSVVFHSAATIKFNEELKAAMEMNVKGPMHLLEVCRQMKRLEAVVHVSTAFNNLDRNEIKEEIYVNPKVDPLKLIELLDSLDDDAVKNIEAKLIGSCPNTYTYTKGLAEQLLEEKCGNIPLVIVRPSIVTAALSEPMPGWVDNMNGTTGTIAAVGKGFFRIIKTNEDLVSDIIPVDYPINLMIAVAWYKATRRQTGVKVYSCTTSHQNPLTWGLLKRLTMKAWLKYPTIDMMWYPSCNMTVGKISLKVNQVLFHDLPAHLIDLFNSVTGKRTKWVRLYAKANQAFIPFEFFTTHQWRFLSSNYIHLMDDMSDQDQQLFYFDVRKIEWEKYFDTYVLGTRRFILKDDISTLHIARRNLYRLRMAQLFVRSILFSFIFLALKKIVPYLFVTKTLKQKIGYLILRK